MLGVDTFEDVEAEAALATLAEILLMHRAWLKSKFEK